VCVRAILQFVGKPYNIIIELEDCGHSFIGYDAFRVWEIRHGENRRVLADCPMFLSGDGVSLTCNISVTSPKD